MFHFFFALLFIPLTGSHTYFLHLWGSREPTGSQTLLAKIPFFPLLYYMDMEAGLVIIIFYVATINFGLLRVFEEFENFNEANPIMAPPHIQPE